MSTSSRPPVALVDNQGRITPTWGRLWDRLWSEVFGGSVSQSTRLVAPTQLGTTPSTLYTAPGYVQVSNASVTNSTGAAVTCNVYIAPLGKSASNANIVATLSVAANSTAALPSLAGQVINTGETLQASASSGSALTLIVSGVLL